MAMIILSWGDEKTAKAPVSCRRDGGDRGRLLAQLQPVERSVAAVAAQEVVVAAGFDDRAVLDYQDAVSMHDGVEAMGDHDGGAAFAQVRDRVLHQPFGFGIERG